MKRRKPRAPHAAHPPVHLPITAVLAERRYIMYALMAHGVHARHREDVFQFVVLGAWRAIEEGRYRPDSRIPPSRALRVWLYSLCWRHAAHHRERAHVRYEIASANPWAGAPEPTTEPLDWLDARAAKVALWSLPPGLREIVAMLGAGYGLTEIARALGVPISTAANRIRKARALLLAALTRGGR
jgi:RNA polymerase sigma-70 factor (ECF subfamily)